eukprot:m51a1_g10251 putative ubiquitin carboxyl-terminal hydrolase isozyme l5 isoform 1 (332) ;mRNA; r:60838-62421
MAGTWCTIESDPGVFTELMAEIGIKGTQVEELWSLDKAEFERIKPVHGLIFLFKWRPDDPNTVAHAPTHASYFPNVFFANQIINNACATQAILSVVMNCPQIDIGETLRSFREFTRDFPPEDKGLAISNCEVIRNAHNSFSRSEHVVYEQKKAKDDDDVYHFISYVPVDGVVYELDGLKPGPVPLGDCAGKDWLSVAAPAIQARIDRYSATEIHFNLLAIVTSRTLVLADQRQRLLAERQALDPASPRAAEIDALLENVAAMAAAEDDRRRQWAKENQRRKHDYIPFVVTLLKTLAENGQLAPLVDKAIARQKQEEAAQKAKASQTAPSSQ